MLIDSHTYEDKKGKLRANFLLERTFGFWKTLKKITKGWGFELQLKTWNEIRIINYTTLKGNDVKLTVNFLYLYIPGLVSSPEQRQIFNKTNKSSFTLSFGSWLVDRKPVITGDEYQLAVVSASKINVFFFKSNSCSSENTTW